MADKKFKYVFVVQGEGRGHMTQAITLFEILTQAGHEVAAVCMGRSKRRDIPTFFTERISCPIHHFKSPNFLTDKDNKSIRLMPSIFYNMQFLGRYGKSLNQIDQVVKKYQPDVLINFYDFLGGFYGLLYKKNIKFVAVGHQFLIHHPDFEFAEGSPMDKRLFKVNNMLNSFRADKKLALSFAPYHPRHFKDTAVTPPLLRDEIEQLAVTTEDFFLGYMVNDGYSQEIMNWHENHREVKLHCFWDKKGMPEVYEPHPNLTFHQLDGEKFLDHMRRCKGLVTTAGFESICEAMYLGKPVMMIPVAGQYEQACNAIDAEKAGAGIYDTRFDISKFIDYVPRHQLDRGQVKKWFGQTKEIMLHELTHFE